MTTQLATIPKVGSLTFHTSNMINWDRLKRKPILSSTLEVVECLKCLINCWRKDQDEKALQYETSLNVECQKHRANLQSERDDLRVTAKVYLAEADPSYVREAIESAFGYLGVSDIDTLIVAFRWQSLFNPAVPLESVQAVWAVLEEFVDDGRIHRLGVADFKMEQLQQLHDSVQTKPSVNQLSLQSCCVIPQDLAQYAKHHGIQLTTHYDAVDFLPDETLQETLSDIFSPRDGMLWAARWICRYSIVYTNRSIIRSKGYVIKAERDVKKLPYCSH